MNRTDAIKAIVWLDQLAAQAKAEAAKLRADLVADARAEFDEQGTAPTWRIPDVATVAASVSHETVYVADEAVFTKWAVERYPTEVETIRRIRESWRTRFLGEVIVEFEGLVDRSTGEVVPGLAVKAGGEFAGISIRPTSAAKEVFSALAEHGLRELVAKASPAVPVVLAEVTSGSDA